MNKIKRESFIENGDKLLFDILKVLEEIGIKLDNLTVKDTKEFDNIKTTKKGGGKRK